MNNWENKTLVRIKYNPIHELTYRLNCALEENERYPNKWGTHAAILYARKELVDYGRHR